ncbi:MAG TPA: SGNH/GDSL hydrolase family protein [Trichocoleus sp.]
MPKAFVHVPTKEPAVLPAASQFRWAAALSLAWVALAPLAAEAANFNRLFVFGDSLSDPGNTASVTFGLVPPPVLLGTDQRTGSFGFVPAYEQRRFTNQLNWVDYLAPQLAAGTSINFAFAGATTGTLNTTISFLPALQQQVGLFLGGNFTPTAEDLFIVWAGSNDYLAVAGQTDPTVPVGNLEQAIRSLAGAGAQNILVSNLPDLGKTPLVSSRANAPQVSALVNQHNSLLSSKLTALEEDPTLASVDLIPLDVFSLFENAIANPAAFGFSNVTNACLSPSPVLSLQIRPVTRCANPNEYLSWDGLHPSARGHQLVAETALQTLLALPPVPATPPADPLPAADGLTFEPSIASGAVFEADSLEAATVSGRTPAASVPEPNGGLAAAVLGLLALSRRVMTKARNRGITQSPACVTVHR